MHLTKICPTCLKKYRKCINDHQTVETCKSEFRDLEKMRSICESSCSRRFFRKEFMHNRAKEPIIKISQIEILVFNICRNYYA